MASAAGEAFIATSIQAPAQLFTDITFASKRTLLYSVTFYVASLSDVVVHQELGPLKSSIYGLLHEHIFESWLSLLSYHAFIIRILDGSLNLCYLGFGRKVRFCNRQTLSLRQRTVRKVHSRSPCRPGCDPRHLPGRSTLRPIHSDIDMPQ